MSPVNGQDAEFKDDSFNVLEIEMDNMFEMKQASIVCAAGVNFHMEKGRGM